MTTSLPGITPEMPRWKKDYLSTSNKVVLAETLSPTFVGFSFQVEKARFRSAHFIFDQEVAEICYLRLNLLLVAVEARKYEGGAIDINPNGKKITPNAIGLFISDSSDKVKRAWFYCRLVSTKENSAFSFRSCQSLPRERKEPERRKEMLVQETCQGSLRVFYIWQGLLPTITYNFQLSFTSIFLKGGRPTGSPWPWKWVRHKIFLLQSPKHLQTVPSLQCAAYWDARRQRRFSSKETKKQPGGGGGRSSSPRGETRDCKGELIDPSNSFHCRFSDEFRRNGMFPLVRWEKRWGVYSYKVSFLSLRSLLIHAIALYTALKSSQT